MTRIAKRPLKMANGVIVRTIEDLKKNFDIEIVVGYFLDGNLSKWLETRGYKEELEQVDNLTENDTELAKKLCDIFGVECIGNIKIDTEDIIERKEKLLKLKQYTDDEEIIANVDSVAFNQEELADLYDKGVEKIYLCEGPFSIPKSKKDLDYIEIGKVDIFNVFKKENLVNNQKIEEIKNQCYQLLNDFMKCQCKIKKEPIEFKLYTEGVLISGNITSRSAAERKAKEYLATAYDKRENSVRGMASRLARQCKLYSCYDEKEGNFYFDKLNHVNKIVTKCNDLLKEITFNHSGFEIEFIEIAPKNLQLSSLESLINELCNGVVRYDGCYSLESYVNYVDIDSKYEGSGFFGDKFTYTIHNIQNAVDEMKRDLNDNFNSCLCDKYIENANLFIEGLCDEINKRKEVVKNFCI